jgi:hypothetical protein
VISQSSRGSWPLRGELAIRTMGKRKQADMIAGASWIIVRFNQSRAFCSACLGA